MKYRTRSIIICFFLSIIAVVIVGVTAFRIKSFITANKAIHEMAVINEQKEAEEKEKEEAKRQLKESIMLVNKENTIGSEYVPDDLVELDTPFISNGNPNVNKMSKVAADALKEMFDAAEKDKVYLLGVSGFRDYDYQKSLYESEIEVFGKNKASRYVAMPGTSEHETGLAVDVLSQDYQTLDEGFDTTAAYIWLKYNCADYGFIIRYPEGKEGITGYEYEPWHIRYVGKTAAEEIMDKGITLEEYLNE